jgi:hypothetical protein
MATKTKNKTFDPRTEIHDLIRKRYKGASVWYLQRVFREKPIGSLNSETVVLTQVWRREGKTGILMIMEQWEHHPEQTGRDPFKHQGEWVYMDLAEARQVWNEFVWFGAVQIQ